MTFSPLLFRCGLLLSLSAALAYSQCTFTVTPSPAFVDSTAQNVTLQVNASDPTCSWNASGSSFATIPGSSSGTVTGQNTNFLQGLTTVSAGSTITTAGISVVSSTKLTAQFFIPPNATAAPVSVIALTGPEEAVGPNLFTVGGAGGIAPGAVTIDSFSFLPPTLTVSAGATITWTNQQTGVTHTVASDDGSFASQNIPSGGTFSQVITTPGTYTYHCNIHVFMKGSITVQ